MTLTKHLYTIIESLGEPNFLFGGASDNHKPMEYRKVFDDTFMEVLLGKDPLKLKAAMDKAAAQITEINAKW